MTRRGTALALAALLFAGVASSARADCCSSSDAIEQRVAAADCCADAGDCPLQIEASSFDASAVVPGIAAPPTAGILAADSIASKDRAPRFSPSNAFAPAFAPSSGPPLYRLHAQLLI